ncbi:hypothetical protein KBI23_19335 [bacterium]|nr:hypothetical protein [bacterium]
MIELDEAFINKEARKYQPGADTEMQILVMTEEEIDHARHYYALSGWYLSWQQPKAAPALSR